MSRILQRGETGFGILIESDAGYIDKSLNKGFLNEGVLELDPNQPILINCILQKWGTENKNGRIYPKEILIPQVDAYQKLIDMNSAVSEADHPDSSVVSLHNISHIIRKMWWGKNGDDENILYGQLELITSPAYMNRGEVFMIGDKVAEYLKRGIRLGISSRGVGSLEEVNGKNIVQDDFELICFDLVASPSTPGAFLFPERNELQISGESISYKNKQLVENINKKERLTNAMKLLIN
jgi:hypothetical protein